MTLNDSLKQMIKDEVLKAKQEALKEIKYIEVDCLLNAELASRVLHCGLNTLRALVKSGKLNCVYIDGSKTMRFRASDINAYTASL